MSATEVVVDASLALKWVIEEPYSEEANTLLSDWRRHRRQLLAPTLFLYEITSALAKRIQRRQFSLAEGMERLRFFLDNGPLLRQVPPIHPRALELTERFNFQAAYDAHYLALAEAHRCECWTADERLWNRVKGELAWVRWVGERVRKQPTRRPEAS